MEIYKTLESLGFFDWLDDTHDLRDTDMKPEYLDKLSLNDIHRTVVNSMAFRWFRDRAYDVKIEKESTGLYFGFHWSGVAWVIVGIGSYEEAELACLNKLIEIVKNK